MSRKDRIRVERRLQRLGSPHAICVLCGFDRPEALTLVRLDLPPDGIRRRLVERHHPLGKRAAPDFTVPLCRNCHAVITEQERTVGAVSRRRPDPTTDGMLRALLYLPTAWLAFVDFLTRLLLFLTTAYSDEEFLAKLPADVRACALHLLDVMKKWVQGGPDAAEELERATSELVNLLRSSQPEACRVISSLLSAFGLRVLGHAQKGQHDRR